MLFSLRTVALSAVLCLPLMALGQTSDPPPSSDGTDASQPAKTPADVAYEPIGRDLQNLQKSMMNKGGVTPDDHAVICKLRDRAAGFSREFPNDVRGPAAELILSKWLKDEELVQRLYGRIVELQPENWDARLSWAKVLHAQNRFTEVVEVLALLPEEQRKDAANAVLYAEALFAEHRFDETVKALEHLPEATSTVATGAAKPRAAQLLEAAKTCASLWPEELSKRQQEESAGDLPRAMLVTERGQIMLELFENEAPNTVANFISLADQGFYNKTKFHRVIPNFMAQGGDPNSKPDATGTPGEGNPGYYIPDEHDREDHRNHFTGSLSMAKTAAPNTGGCQFFITVTPTPHLNGLHTVFGRVVDGLEVARSIRQDDEIELVTIIRRRPHEYKPVTLPLTQAPPPPPPSAKDVVDPATPPPAEEPQNPPPAPPDTNPEH